MASNIYMPAWCFSNTINALTQPRRPIAGRERETELGRSAIDSILAEDGVPTSRGAHEEGTIGGTERAPSWRHVANGHESLKQGTCGVDSAFGSGQGWHTTCSRAASVHMWPITRLNAAPVCPVQHRAKRMSFVAGDSYMRANNNAR